ncbi:hypothetical protein Ahy_A09g043349 [Arachis hypogaea]|uniref:Uncharacterized protein n=1 Tax=Arachis hypogaea TaxID=3818 RepID=A0A445BI34_ARAHY|nr:hypothetical protein Ahy_A09g043349 [Arachis hypogaea]
MELILMSFRVIEMLGDGVSQAYYGVLRFVMENGTKGCEQYLENRLKYLADQKAEGINPYPHNRNDSRISMQEQKKQKFSGTTDFGLMKIDDKGRILSFSENPKGKDIKAMEEAIKKPYIASMECCPALVEGRAELPWCAFVAGRNSFGARHLCKLAVPVFVPCTKNCCPALAEGRAMLPKGEVPSLKLGGGTRCSFPWFPWHLIHA